MQQFDLHEITAPSGTLVHEYVTRQGRVFAVTWQGPLLPTCTSCLETTTSASRRPPRGVCVPHAPAGQHHGCRSGGAVKRANALFSWMAYIPSLLPGGVSAADLHSETDA